MTSAGPLVMAAGNAKRAAGIGERASAGQRRLAQAVTFWGKSERGDDREVQPARPYSHCLQALVNTVFLRV